MMLLGKSTLPLVLEQVIGARALCEERSILKPWGPFECGEMSTP